VEPLIGFVVGIGVGIFSTWFPGMLNMQAGIKEWAVPLLLMIGGVFIIKGFLAREARKKEIIKPYRGGPFKRGLGMSFLNVLNIPMFFALSSWLLAHDIIPNASVPKLLYIFGIGFGALMVFLIYARLSDWFTRNASMLTRNINFVIGGLLVVLAVIQTMRVWSA